MRNARVRPWLARLTIVAVNLLSILLFIGAAWRVLPLVADMRARPHERSLAVLTSGQPTLLVAFQERDCESHARFIRDWRMLADSSAARIVMVPLQVGDSAAMRRVTSIFPTEYHLRPELADATGQLLHQLRRRETPVAVLLDGSGRPRMLIPASDALHNQRRVQEAVLTYLATLRS
jgi:hypothetical protein